MKKDRLQHRETLLIETLLSGLDARESAKEAGAPMLVYLAELLVKRARDELEEVRSAIEGLGETVADDNTI